MAKFILEGGHPLRGSIAIRGNKNAALPILAATLLTEETCVLHNVPEIEDVKVFLEILRDLGAFVKRAGDGAYEIQCKDIVKTALRDDLAKKLRSSLLCMGPLLARFGEVSLTHPGGCVIGKRSIDTHLDALKTLGAEFSDEQNHYIAKRGAPKELRVFLEEASVTATENGLLAASLLAEPVELVHAALEPHVADLVEVLKKMGAEIEVRGTSYFIRGKKKLGGFTHDIINDHIEAATFAVLAAASKSDVVIEGVDSPLLDMPLLLLKKMGARFSWESEKILHIFPSHNLRAVRKIESGLWPGLPTDIVSPFIVLSTQCEGDTLVHDWMFEGRLFFTDKLSKMGANITLCDPHRALIVGPTPLKHAKLESPDLRAGIALVIAALIAEGKSEIDNIYQIDRGYERIDERLRALGANIERSE